LRREIITSYYPANPELGQIIIRDEALPVSRGCRKTLRFVRNADFSASLNLRNTYRGAAEPSCILYPIFRPTIAKQKKS
jgi:hypothetical protein